MEVCTDTKQSFPVNSYSRSWRGGGGGGGGGGGQTLNDAPVHVCVGGVVRVCMRVYKVYMCARGAKIVVGPKMKNENEWNKRKKSFL